jgi:hypothetical protein
MDRRNAPRTQKELPEPAIAVAPRDTRLAIQIAIPLAVVEIFLLGMQQYLQYTLTLGHVVGLLLLPVWIGSLRRYHGAVLATIALLAALISGLWLSSFRSNTHVVQSQYFLSDLFTALGIFVTIGVVLWARRLIPPWTIGLAYGLGLTVLALRQGFDPSAPWKGGIALPTVIIVLSLVTAARSKLLAIVTMLSLGIYSATQNARSMFAELAVAAALVAWQGLPKARSIGASSLRTILALLVIGLVAYNVGVGLLTNGSLGATAQARTIQQIDQSGSLLVGGRPEMAASWALFTSDPLGFGIGVKPSSSDVLIAKEGFYSINKDPNNGYVEKYMFGSTFELHSSVADLWAHYGLFGVAFAGVLVVLLVRSITVSIARRMASGLSLYLTVLCLWNIFFSPFPYSAELIAFTVGLVLLVRSPSGPDRVDTLSVEMVSASSH